MRILITGSREWTDRARLIRTLDTYYFTDDREPLTLVHGACPTGADYLADQWARFLGIEPETHPADWGKYGKRAGNIRNSEMVQLGADLCIAFLTPGCKGTVHCGAMAQVAGIPVRAEFASS